MRLPMKNQTSGAYNFNPNGEPINVGDLGPVRPCLQCGKPIRSLMFSKDYQVAVEEYPEPARSEESDAMVIGYALHWQFCSNVVQPYKEKKDENEQKA